LRIDNHHQRGVGCCHRSTSFWPSWRSLLGCCTWSAGAFTERTVEAGVVDRSDAVLDRLAGLRSHHQAALHAPPPLPYSRTAPGAWRLLYAGNAARRSRWLSLQPGSIWLADPFFGGPFKITGHPFSFSSSAAATDGQVEMTIRNLGDYTSTIGTVPVGQRV
jgi:hypothetical protein